MSYWQHCPESQSLVEGKDWPVSGCPEKVPESTSYFSLPNSEGVTLLLLRTCQSYTSSFLFFPSLPPTSNPGVGGNEEKHTNQEDFSLHCVFQLDLNRHRSIQPALTLPPLFSHVLFVFPPPPDYVFRLRKEQLSSVAWGYKKLQLPVASTTWL